MRQVLKEKSTPQGKLKSKGKPIVKKEYSDCGFPGSASLNVFEDEADFQVFTKRSINPKTGKKFGKTISWDETVQEMYDHVSNDCKGNTDYPTSEDCKIDTLREDNPSYCIFGKRNIKDAVRKLINKDIEKKTNIKDDQYGDLSDEEICQILDIDEDIQIEDIDEVF